MNRVLLVPTGALILSMVFSVGCATKKYVRNQTAPLIDKTNELDDLAAKNTRDLRDVDARAQQGIRDVNAKSSAADQRALAAGKVADEAQGLANQASNRANTLQTTVANLDNYRPVVETSALFGFDRADLTGKAKSALDQFASEIPRTKHSIVVVEGGTDSVGDADYNYALSQRRAAAVIQYLASEHNVPAHKIHVIGLGKDKAVASNASAVGRAKNRRVDVRLMTNAAATETAASGTGSGAMQQH